MPTRRLLLLAAATAAALAACQSAPPVSAPRPIDFAQRGPIVLNAATVGFVDATRPSAGAVHVEDRAPTPPLEAVRQWAAQRLQAAGQSGTVRVVVKDASIVEVALPRTGGITGYFTKDQAQRYDGRLEVEVHGEQAGAASSFSAFAKAVATQSTTVPEDISLAAREAALQELTRRLVEDIDARLDAGIRRDLAPMVVR
ncbi:LPS assembly lipoprotein LptE [Azospirillum sp. ST 5-10]|uniref:LPS assembly lipoprotein LptE n=1 Tax=unclassified Azospirillum TaxID=2630922 RepID=UPI003F4A58DE